MSSAVSSVLLLLLLLLNRADVVCGCADADCRRRWLI